MPLQKLLFKPGINKEVKLQFDMDQIKAALTVFQNTFIASTKETADEVLEENEEK